ncbi:MAG: DUF1385 domain-containing protein [Ruminococcus sp.]|nr:DUF1385 domain-containing protein [Ruminococcus sp.]
MSNTNAAEAQEPIKSKIGGQALVEGIMMKGENVMAVACRLPDKTIDVEIIEKDSEKWYKKVPFVRGCFNFAESLIDGMKCTIISAEKQMTDDDGEEEEELSKFELWLSETKAYRKLEEKLEGEKGKDFMNTLMIVICVITMAVCLCVFKFVPALLSGLLGRLGAPDWCKTAAEGLIKIGLLVGYMWLISRMKEIHKTFMYHGAEHKTIACYEAGLELTVENAAGQTRFHPRCGTSFIFLVVLLSIAIGMFLPWENVWARFGMQMLMLIPEASVGYELIKIAGKYDNIFTRIISAPGIWLQHITTQEPEAEQLEVAIAALAPCIPADRSSDKW